MSILTLIYISDATIQFSDEELHELLEKARRNNHTLGITGLMIYAGGKFFQVLEGDPEQVQNLMEKIEQDPRHNKIVVMSTDLGVKRHFGQWAMGFKKPDATTVAQHLDGYVDVFEGDQIRLNPMDIKSMQVNILIKAFQRIVDAKGVGV